MVGRRLFLVLLLSCTSALPSQVPAKSKAAAEAPDKRSAEEIDKAITLWHDRANAFTEAALDDQWQLHWLQPVLEARLAEAWWKDDPVRAQSWMDGAVQDVTFARKNESDEDRKGQLQAAEAVFRACERLKLDKYAQKVLDYLVAEAQKGGPAGRQGIASVSGSLMMAVEQTQSSDPDRAVDLTSKLIDLHAGDRILQALQMIRYRRPQQADQLYENALSSATASADYHTIYSLVQYPFPYNRVPDVPVSDAVKEFTVNAVGTLLATPPSDQDQQILYCRSAPLLAEHILQYLPPAQQGVIEAAVQTCQSQTGDEAPKDPDSDGNVGPDDCKDADACLKLVETAKTDERRARLNNQAANLAGNEEQNPVRALSILDSLTTEEKEWVPDWENTYWLYGGEAMRKLVPLHDSHTIQTLIDHAPNQLRGQIVMNLLEVEEVRKDKPYAATLLTEAHRALEKFPTDNPLTYLQLLNYSAEIQPDDAIQTFGFVTAGLNHITYPDFEKEVEANKKKGKERPLFRFEKPGDLVAPVNFNPIVLDQDESYVVAAIKSLDDPETRAAFRLTCVRYSLKRYNQQKKAKEALMAKKP